MRCDTPMVDINFFLIGFPSYQAFNMDLKSGHQNIISCMFFPIEQIVKQNLKNNCLQKGCPQNAWAHIWL